MTKTTSSIRSGAFKATRKTHSNESAEDYTELVADLIEANGEARTVEVARHLGISHVTALRTIRRLQNEGFFETAKHKPIYLTAKGKKLAAYCKERHQTILQFLNLIGVPEKVAEVDAEGVEHHISKETLRALKEHISKFAE